MKKYTVIPLVITLFLLPFSPFIDLSVTRFFYDIGSNSLFDFLYHYGEYPALLTCGFSGFFYFCSFILKKIKPYRPYFLLAFLTLAIGSGFLINGVLKEYFGRPRPIQLEEFGGKYEFKAVYEPIWNPTKKIKSFPSGHASMGFYFLVFILIGKRLNNSSLITFGAIVGIGYGILLSLTRISQLGHFFSDTFFSAIIMWYTALILDFVIFNERINKKTV